MAALSPHADIRDFVEEHGGGDIDLVKRWVVQQAEKEKKVYSASVFPIANHRERLCVA